MSSKNETPEQKREQIRQQELRHPSSSIQGSNLADLVGSLGWKGTGIWIVAILVVIGIVSVLFR
ncbi:hypothetical protein HNO89_000903 [Sporosarcina luteola]|nr:hypothetical protein [Sporosarcina luteola]